LTEYLLFKYSKSVGDLLNAPQGENTELINDAQSKVEAAQAKVEQFVQQLKQQRQALAAQKKAEAVAKVALAEVRATEVAVCAAEPEAKAALAEVQAQEDLFNNECTTLQSKINDPDLGIVTKNRSKIELAQLKSKDPLALSRAKITHKAAVKKVEHQRKVTSLLFVLLLWCIVVVTLWCE